MKKIITITLLSSFLMACATTSHKDVRPSVDGNHYVSISAKEPQAASQEALSQANSYCKSTGGQMFVVKEEKLYQGKMSQEQYETHKVLSEVAIAAGSAIWVFGDDDTEGLGQAVSIAGGTYNATLDSPYVTTLTFQCQ
uniref:hypothetical protein n=1 Tax=Thaumasiovibrio occultus TaxID=1891184 RepID=UPI000B34EF51|nr:hypothetical protein [Thaumasiovibrio occultus]